MNFLIADTFTDSLARLNGEEQKAVKTTAFDLQLDPTRPPGMSFHKLDRAKDRNFWSVRVDRDIRLIVHRSQTSLLLCYVDHHDKAYSWAERRRLQTHPTTGAAQLVEVRETVEEIVVPVYVEQEVPAPSLFAGIADEVLLGYGVPPEWLADARGATEESLLVLADYLPAEAAEALLELATGGEPVPDQPTGADPFEHPDAQRRFRVVANIEELERALEFPWEKWSVFLHPAQRQWVERDYGGPARVSGSAGTGKTIVALHRAAHLARANPDSRILLATFSEPLANLLRTKLLRLVGNEPSLLERIDVHSLDSLGRRLYRAHIGPVELAGPALIRALILTAAKSIGSRFRSQFLVAEWEQVVDAWQLDTWEQYRDVARLGRKTRLREAQRQELWSVFQTARAELRKRGVITAAGMFNSLAGVMACRNRPIFDHAIVDEAQDLGPAQLRFFAALGTGRPNGLFFAGDMGQRIFQQPFSWAGLGVEIRGRSRVLRVNYRTSHQIRSQADRLLGPEVTDVDGNKQDRTGTVSVFNGPAPVIQILDCEQREAEQVAEWVMELSKQGVEPHEFGVFVRSGPQLTRAKMALDRTGIAYRILDEDMAPAPGHLSLITMHLAKGLEFRAAVVMACDDEIVPLQERIEKLGDEADLQEIYETERHLLYVACTRARDHLLITAVEPGSEFLEDMLWPDNFGGTS
ncbi:MAG: UvrD-helicase domain-containing protein [Actinomycetota bacterium]